MTYDEIRELSQRLRKTLAAIQLTKEAKRPVIIRRRVVVVKGGKTSPPKRNNYPWATLDVNEYFIVHCEPIWAVQKRVINGLGHPPKKEVDAGKKFVRRADPKGVRVWRVK